MSRKRYPTDLTDAQWARVEPHLPKPKSGGRKGGRPATDDRAVVDAICYHVRAGGSWRMRPHDFPPWQTVYGYFCRWRDDGTWERAHDRLREEIRVAAGMAPTPATGRLDSQTVKTTHRGGPKGYDGGKKGGRPQAVRGGRFPRADLGPDGPAGMRTRPGRRPVARGGHPGAVGDAPGGHRGQRV